MLDAVGALTADTVLASLPSRASFVSYGLLSESKPTAAYLRRIVVFSLLASIEHVSKATWSEWFDDLWALLQDSELPQASCFDVSSWRMALKEHSQPSRRAKAMLRLCTDSCHV